MTAPGISNAELAQSLGFSYNIIRTLTAAMEKEGDITGRVERSGLYSKTLWHVSAFKKCLQEPEGRMSTRTRAEIESPATRPVRVRVIEGTPAATHAVRVRVVEQEAQPATYPVRVHVAEEAQPPTRRVPFPEVEEYFLPAKHSTRPREVQYSCTHVLDLVQIILPRGLLS